jgi:hypothetical protein
VALTNLRVSVQFLSNESLRTKTHLCAKRPCIKPQHIKSPDSNWCDASSIRAIDRTRTDCHSKYDASACPRRFCLSATSPRLTLHAALAQDDDALHKLSHRLKMPDYITMLNKLQSNCHLLSRLRSQYLPKHARLRSLSAF